MVNSKDFGNRIQEMMDYYGISASAFADSIAIGRSSISHILSGRNKPSLDFVLKITDTYPEADLYWLIEGKGGFPKSKNPQTTAPLPTPPTMQQNETSTPIFATEESNQDLFSLPDTDKEAFIKADESTRSTTELIEKSIPPIVSNDKKIDRIVILYADGTFDTYKHSKS